MLPIDTLPAEILTLLAQSNIVEENTLDAALHLDMLSESHYGSVWLVLCSASRLLYRITANEIETIPFDEAVDPYTDSLTTVNRLVAYHADGTSHVLGYATNATKDRLYAFLAVWNKLRAGETVTEEDSLFEPFRRCCPKCGKPYPHRHRRVCPDCDKRKGALGRVLSYYLEYKWQNVIIFACILLSSAIALVTPLINGKFFFDQVITAPTFNEAGEQLTGRYHSITYVYVVVGVLFALAILDIVLTIIRSRATISMSSEAATKMRIDVFEAMQRQSLSYFNEHPTGKLMSMVGYDADRIRSFFDGSIPHLIINVIKLVGMTVFLLMMNWKLTLLIYLPVPIIFCIYKFRLPKVWRAYSHMWRRNSRWSAMLGDSLNGIRVVKAFSKENDEQHRFYTLFSKVTDANLRANLISLTVFPVTSLLIGITHQAIWGVGGIMVIGQSMTYGELSTYLGYIGMVFAPLVFFSTFVNQLTDVANAASRMCETLDAQPDVQPALDPVHTDRLDGRIEFSQVFFHYKSNRPILKDVSFTIKPGQHVGLVGHTGSGKSTVANLITRMYDTVSGTVTLDGINVNRYDAETLRRNVAIVSQEVFLFHGTIADNIRYARPEATMEEVIAAARAANAHNFIMRLPEGYETRVGGGARSLSGGERQRISIARALLISPAILILDEATAAMDTETERQISDAIDRLITGRTTISIAHRLSTLKNCDVIMAIEHGTLAEMGTVEELMEKKGVYYNLYTLQQSQLQKVMSGS